MKNLKHWSNNFAGGFIVSVLFLIITLAVNKSDPANASTFMTGFFIVLSLVMLVGWTFCAFRAAESVAVKTLFDQR
jgi:glycerol uptake facilitator-like aquaporin